MINHRFYNDNQNSSLTIWAFPRNRIYRRVMSILPEELTSREALTAWLLDFHRTSASLDAHAFATNFFTTDAEVQYANNPVSKGRDAVQRDFGAAFKNLDLMAHDIDYFDFVAGPQPKLYQAAKIRYVVRGDNTERDVIELPGMMVAWLGVEGARLKMKRCEIFLDASKVFGRMIERGLL